MKPGKLVYFIRAGDAVKIGTTYRVQSRIKDIERDIGMRVELIGSIIGDFATENLIHKRLAAHDEGNEWFADCPEVRALIAFLLERGPGFSGLPPLPK